jgi:hypothetical protein
MGPQVACLGDPVEFPGRTVSRLLLPFASCAGAALLGCALPAQPTQLSQGPEPVQVRMRPALPHAGQVADLEVESPMADSIVLESANGLDRYSTAGPLLRVRLGAGFGDTANAVPSAVRWKGRLLDLEKRPATIRTCRQRRCREFYHEIPLQLSEQNQHSVSLTAGWSSVFARRAITGGNRTVLFREALNSGIWTVQGEWAGRDWNVQARGFVTPDEHGGALDLSRVVSHGEELSFGVAMHLGLVQGEWLPEERGPVLANRAVYQIGIGPSVMLQGITASTQLGVYTDGTETLQTVSTRISANGNLTSVRQPVTMTAEKSFAFGRGAIVSRRRDAVESFSAAVQLVDDFAVKIGVTSHRIAWPDEDPASDLRGSETLFTLGGQYSITW